jgi:hypothetical protein
LKIRIALAIAAVMGIGGTASAQGSAQKPAATELGVDANLTIGLGDNSFTNFNIPSGTIRAGFPMNNRVSIEPRGRLSVTSGGGDTFTSYVIGVGALYHFDAAANMRSGLYLRPSVGVSGFSGDDSDANFFAGVGLGLKRPILAQLGSRFEGGYIRNFGNGGSNGLELSAGLSWFTR